ncbi:uncharacterized protein LOC113331007 [Papaver somniferum]|uniref:uncharacterized protein LOC113331007 n=1 Tax=Papaver somniferum TaxID=3469 RepID=UPI000E6FAF26|nr:uncharacterized protein LOC113331007 [Papaver somniferum]
MGNHMFVLVSKMKRVKHILIKWKKAKFQHLSVKTLEAKKEMQCAQEKVQKSPFYPVVAKIEREVVSKYSTLTKYEESMLKQKSRVQWLDLGDSNNSFFHNSIKERRSMNNILTLTSTSGEQLDEDIPIAKECIDLYSLLFDELKIKNCDTSIFDSLNFNHVVDQYTANDLIRDVTRDEIIFALSTIGSNKAPGQDGFSSHFSKLVGQLAIQYNILVSHELVRNYHRSNGTPRCAVKIDLKKAYDTYSILINGSPYGFFGAGRGLRQGCPISTYLFVIVMEILNMIIRQQVTAGNLASAIVLKSCLDIFSSCSGLEINKQKYSIYSSAIDPYTLDQMVACLDCSVDSLPVKYLGLYFTNVAANLKHIWDIVSGAQNVWTHWVQRNLIKNRYFWQLKTPQDSSWCWGRILELIDISKDHFVFIIGDGSKVNFLNDVWHPKGRLTDWVDSETVTELFPDKTASVSEYIENGSWHLPPTSTELAQQVVSEITILDFNPAESDVVIWRPSSHGFFTIKDTYKTISNHNDPVIWLYLVWFKNYIPRQSFITWVTLHGRLKTRAKLKQWGLIENPSCVLCDGGIETEDHLLHEYNFAAIIWKSLLLKLGYDRVVHPTWKEEIMWCIEHFAGSDLISTIKKLVFTVVIPYTWLRPEGDIIMVNTDGSKTDLSGGSGAIIRYKNGDVIDCAIGGSSPISAPAHELQGVELGLKLAVFHNCQDIHV